MRCGLLVIAILAGCADGGLLVIPVESLPFNIDFCHVSRVTVDPDTGRVFMLDKPEEPPDIITAADCNPLQWMTLSPGAGRPLSRTTAMTWDPIGRRLILYERSKGDILGLRGTGGSPVVLANVVSAGVDRMTIGRIVFDAARNRALMIDAQRDLVLAFDVATGSSSVVSPSGSGPAFVFPKGLAVDPTRDRLLVCDSALDQVVAVDLATGGRSTLDLPGRSAPQLIDIDVAGDRAFLADRGSVVEVDLATGSQEVLASAGGAIEDMDFDACGNRLLFNAVVFVTAFDLATRTSSLFAQ